MTYLPLVHNITLVVTLGALYALLHRPAAREDWTRQALMGGVFGAFTLLAMRTPLAWSPGVIFDGRSVLLGLAGLFGGPVTAGVAAILAALYRLWLGGGGATMGVLVILSSALLGTLVHHLRPRLPGLMRPLGLLALGFAIHAVMVLLMQTLPGGLTRQVFLRLGLPVLVIHPLAFLLASLFFLEVESRRRAEADLHIKGVALDSSITAIALADPQGILTFVNPAALQLWGYASPSEVVGRPTALFWEDPSESLLIVQQVLAQGSSSGERMARHRDGHLFPVQFQTSLVRDVRGRPVGLMGSFLDITARRRDEAERRELSAQLHQSQKLESLGSLAGGVAHDINNVLAAILALASTHREGLPEGHPMARPLDVIVQACTRGRNVVRGLLYFARKDVERRGPVDLNLLLRELVSLLESTTLKKVSLVTELSEGLPPLEGDGGALSHAFMNLCVNALDAMPEGGTLTLETLRAGPQTLEVRVRDTGVGMPQDVIQKALDPFFTTKPVGKGTGLGLSMVYGTVKAHGGSLDLRSHPGEGTEVRIQLPIGKGPLGESHLESEAPEERVRPLQVLLVDDDPLVRDALVPALARLGHQAVAVAEAREALARLEAGQAPDVIILDMNMPGMTGAEALPLILARRPGQRVIIASGYSVTSLDTLLEGHPGVSFIHKPFTLKELKARLRDVHPAS